MELRLHPDDFRRLKGGGESVIIQAASEWHDENVDELPPRMKFQVVTRTHKKGLRRKTVRLVVASWYESADMILISDVELGSMFASATGRELEKKLKAWISNRYGSKRQKRGFYVIRIHVE